MLESKVDRAGEKSAVSSGPATIAVSALENDDFGDFESASTPSNAPPPQLLLDLSGYDPGAISKSTPTSTFRGKYIRAHTAQPPRSHTHLSAHTELASIASSVPSLCGQGHTLHLLARFFFPSSSSYPHGTSARCCSRPPSTGLTRGC